MPLTLDVGVIAEWMIAGSAILGGVGGLIKFINRDVKRDISDLNHRSKNLTMRTDALERLRNNDIERLVKVESSVQNIERAIDRIEKNQERLSDTLTERFDELTKAMINRRD